jgi:hypothetical protein
MAQGVKVPTEDIIAALKKSSGMIVAAARILGCDPSVIHLRKKRVAKVMETIKTEREKFIDVAEIKLQQAVQRGDLRAIIFALKTVGRDRGYVPHSAVEIDANINSMTGVLVVPEAKNPDDWVAAMRGAGALPKPQADPEES